jgi:RNA polymerase sigma-70 factor, ECF subfamily
MPADRPQTPATDAIVTAVRGFQRNGPDSEEHFTLLVECFYPVVRGFFTRRVGTEDALDLTQRTFTRVYEKLKDLREPEKFGGWLLTIARNILSRFLQQRRSESLVLLPSPAREDDAPDLVDRLADGRDDSLEQLLNAEQKAQLRAAVADLPPKMRQCVELRVRGLEYRQIADEVGISIQTVKAHLFQAKARLRERLRAAAPGRG